jgi:hypothetical protein
MSLLTFLARGSLGQPLRIARARTPAASCPLLSRRAWFGTVSEDSVESDLNKPFLILPPFTQLA